MTTCQTCDYSRRDSDNTLFCGRIPTWPLPADPCSSWRPINMTSSFFVDWDALAPGARGFYEDPFLFRRVCSVADSLGVMELRAALQAMAEKEAQWAETSTRWANADRRAKVEAALAAASLDQFEAVWAKHRATLIQIKRSREKA